METTRSELTAYDLLLLGLPSTPRTETYRLCRDGRWIAICIDFGEACVSVFHAETPVCRNSRLHTALGVVASYVTDDTWMWADGVDVCCVAEELRDRVKRQNDNDTSDSI